MLCQRENDVQVNWNEDIVLNGISLLNKDISAETLLITGRDEMVEPNKAALERFWRIAVQACEDDTEDRLEVGLNGRA